MKAFYFLLLGLGFAWYCWWLVHRPEFPAVHWIHIVIMLAWVLLFWAITSRK